MSRAETLTALAAVVLASLAALQIPGRIVFALVAIALLMAVGALRLRAALTERKQPRSGFDAADRARRIREEREKRLGG